MSKDKKKTPLEKMQKDALEGSWALYKEGVTPLQKEEMDPLEIPTQRVEKKQHTQKGRPECLAHSYPQATKTPSMPSVEKIIRRPRRTPQATLDLHGYSRQDAHEKLISFVQQSIQTEKTWVRVVTGKSVHKKLAGQHEETLSHNFLLWIQQPPLNALVTGYSQASYHDGGTGAYYLRLKSVRRL
ncbi:Smr/MutS family protein [Alphaproteobacteria bacterium]|nr:Smr/MutS family protein [Alphaproteobacteria bacterium]